MSLNTVVEKYNANISRSGIYARFHVPISGTITAADVLAATVSGYNWIFNVAINGTGQFAGASRFNVGVGTESVHKTGLSIAVTKGDIITFVCEAAGTGGGLFAPTEFAITIDDGLSASNVLGPASATNNAIALFDGTTGKLIKDSAKTISIDGTLAGNSDALIPTQKAVKTYSDQLLAAADAMTFKGVINCSANPNYPAGNAGDVYRVSVAGKIGGASGLNVEVSDQLLCLTDSTASGDQATVGANWSIAQANIDGAVVGPTSATADAIALFNSTTGKIIKDSAKTISTDGTFASNSDALIPTQKATKTYVDAAVLAGGGGSYNGGRPTDALNRIYFQDDFLFKLALTGSTYPLWQVVGASASGSYKDGESNHPGIVTLQTNTTTNAVAGLSMHVDNSYGPIKPSDYFDIIWYVRPVQNSSAAVYRIGLFQKNVSGAYTDAICFHKEAASSAFKGETRASSTSSQTAAFNNYTANTWQKLRLRRIDGSTIGFTVNAETEKTLTTNVPTAVLVPAAYVVNVTSFVAILDIDYFDMEISGTGRA